MNRNEVERQQCNEMIKTHTPDPKDFRFSLFVSSSRKEGKVEQFDDLDSASLKGKTHNLMRALCGWKRRDAIDFIDAVMIPLCCEKAMSNYGASEWEDWNCTFEDGLVVMKVRAYHKSIPNR